MSGAARDENARVAALYEDLVAQFGVDPRALEWGSRASQLKRFDVLIEIGELAGRSVLDVGCGLADLSAFLEVRRIPVTYTGYDIAPAVIRIAKQRFPQLDLRVADPMTEDAASAKFDFVLASGVFSSRPVGSYAYLDAMTRRMFQLCRRGVAFNSLSGRSDLVGSDQFLADPGRVLTMCLEITQHVVLRHDYMPHDFTVYLYKG